MISARGWLYLRWRWGLWKQKRRGDIVWYSIRWNHGEITVDAELRGTEWPDG